jgi:cobalt transporter subunit CbtA
MLNRVLNRVFLVALHAGLAAGLLVAVFQHFTATPLILKAEVYEVASSASTPAKGDAASLAPRLILVHSHGERGASPPAHAGPAQRVPAGTEWAPEDGLERTAYTSFATIVTAVGFALLLLAGMIAAGDQIEPRRALGWGAAAFVTTGLAPAIGLPPELPGTAAGDLGARQLWWILTAIATGAALWLLLRTSGWRAKLAGVVLLVAPHVIGAPTVETFTSTVPAELAAKFAAISLAIQAMLWLTCAYFAALFWSRSSREAAIR